MYRKKIVHITQAHGGIKTYIENIIGYANLNLFDFVVIAPAHKEFEKFCSDRGVRYHVVNLKRSINPLQDIAVLIKIINILKKEKPEVIHAHSAKGGFIGRLAGKFSSAKVIYTPNGFSYLSFTGLKRIIFYMLEYVAKRWTDLLLAVSYSEANRAFFELGFQQDKVRVVLNSIGINQRAIRYDYTNNYRIRMIGRLTYQKNPMLFFEIAKRLLAKNPHLKFSILGAGVHDHLNKEINEFLRNNNLENKIDILKWGDSDTSQTFLDNTDIFVLTSSFEGLPFSLLEAMERFIPCVVSKADGNSDVIQNNENGFACINVEEFCSKIELLVNDEDLRRKIGQAGNCYVTKKHSMTTNIIQIENTYTSLATKIGEVKILTKVSNERVYS